jgi:8-oxo-dGTP pyrophosphatase MutT (NUDIX family)
VNEVVRAAGGLVIHTSARGPEVAVVHRPRYDDWSVPKGKRDPGETDEQCAVREVEEETGLRCALGRELLPTRYVDRKGRPKVVRYWEMAVLGSRPFEANDEIDQLVWLPIDEAVGRLSYRYDADVLANVRLPFTSGSSTSC